jgi:hypothetical protein
MLWPDGRLSDLANLSRIKDAAVTILERGPPGKKSPMCELGVRYREGRDPRNPCL